MNYFRKHNICSLFSVLCLFIAITYCEKSRHKRLDGDSVNEGYLTVNADDFNEDMSAVEVRCDRNFKKESNSLHRQSLCRPPRKQLVALKMPSKYYMPGVYHRPNSYEVDRCDGVCQHPNHMCLPIEKQIIEVPVTSDFIYSRLLNAGSRATRQSVPPEKCMRIKVEKHVLCSCQCVMSAKNCNEKQIFSEDRCACECRDTSQAKTCSQKNRMWSNEKCQCVCPPTTSRDCSSGALFDETTCRCLQT